ncbi:MAG: DUF3105 domain-containing protein [Nocardioidaceae bacterium]
MAKSSKDRDRRARAEEIRKQQAAQERRRTLLVLLACVLVGALVIGFAGVKYLDTKRKENRDVDAIGLSAKAAGCQPVERKNAEGSGQHVNPGTTIKYSDAPPAFGKHWANYLQGSEIKNYYTADDRPELERLVHSLEHGYTIYWYDQTIADDPDAVADLKSIADKYPIGDRLIIAPWTTDDGDEFADGTHVVLTHWTGPDNQQGIWQYCKKISGSVVEQFTKDFPAGNAPEAGAT